MTRRFSKPAGRLAIVVAAGLALSACGGTITASSQPASSAAGASPSQGDTLTLAFNSPPPSLNPSASGYNIPNVYLTVAYDSMLTWAQDGSFQPNLATKWGYVGSDYKHFQLTLRPNVKFADGEPLTADAVAASINYFKKGTGSAASGYRDITASATGPLQVTLTSAVPNPSMEPLMTAFYDGTGVIAPKGLADPNQLGTQTFGAGPYVLDPNQTVANDHYTYTANPNYWNPSAIHYKTVIIKAINNVTSAVQAMRTGQLDAYFSGDNANAASAKSAGLTVDSGLSYWDGLQLLDPQGKIVHALGDLRVRQALEYAINRPAIVKAIYGDFGHPLVQPALPNWAEYDPALEKQYSYNPTKAKQLLAAAGFPNGFSFSATSTAVNAKMLQAVGGDLANVGVTLDYVPAASIAAQSQNMAAGKVTAFGLPESHLNTYFMVNGQFLENSQRNPLNETDPQVTDLYNQALQAQASGATAAWQKVLTRLVDNAWTIPVVAVDSIFYISPKITGYQSNKSTHFVDPAQLRPAS